VINGHFSKGVKSLEVSNEHMFCELCLFNVFRTELKMKLRSKVKIFTTEKKKRSR